MPDARVWKGSPLRLPDFSSLLPVPRCRLGPVRGLTPAERQLVQQIFGAALDPDAVHIRQARWWPLQPAHTTMAPDGDIWCHPQGTAWCADYARAPIGLRAHFVHELVHVWQHQQGVPLWRRRWPLARYRYLPLRPGKPFAAYGIEQQAEMVKDAWLLASGHAAAAALPPLAVYRALLPLPLAIGPAADAGRPGKTLSRA